MKVSIITVTHNSASVVPELLESLKFALREADVEGVVAVDNASTDETLEILGRTTGLPLHIVASPTNDGYAAGINRGIEMFPNVSAYLVLNPDVRLKAGAVATLSTCLESHDSVGVVVPRSVRADGQVRYSLRRFPTIGRAWAELLIGGERAARVRSLGDRVGDLGAYQSSHPVDWASGSTMLLTRKCMEQVGRWDESFFLFSEETDFCLRARSEGLLTWYCSEATVTHLGGESRTSAALHGLLTLNRIRLVAKHRGRLIAALFAIPIVTKQATRALRGDPLGPAALQSIFVPTRRHPELRRMMGE